MARRILLVFGAIVLALGLTPVGPAGAAAVTVPVGVTFTDTTGAALHAHGGGMLKVGSYYYWFGENRNADSTFRYVSVYRSTDLRTWEFRRNVLTQNSHSELRTANIERPKVIYNASTGQYVMWMHKENGRDYGEARAAVAVSSTVDGDYTYLRSFRPLNHMSRDITTFVDSNGTAYMISAANENADLHVYRLTANYTDIAALVHTLWRGSYREAPAMFKRGSVYFLLTSGATGWAPNQQKYATASSVEGTWSALQNIGDGTAYSSQTAYVLTIQGSATTSYLYLGDRWAGAWGGPVNDSRYVWLPLQFPSATTMSMANATSVTVDTETGSLSATGLSFERLNVRHSGKCVDVRDGSTADNGVIIQWTCNGGTNQQWNIRDAGGGYVQIVARHSGKCLDVTSAGTADGAGVIQYTCGTGTNQQWRVQTTSDGYVTFAARHSGKCLDLPGSGTADNIQFKQYPCTNATNQQFRRTAL
ncbi:RICIN domain-containing protein [Sphaerisporangium aureirubrum]|uniref:RICIN domain-containing protein n=1 Tax=Sphaerisporangium aureirubrum TaxID=1544736 RepID=A0ABW1NB16_9ACTN